MLFVNKWSECECCFVCLNLMSVNAFVVYVCVSAYVSLFISLHVQEDQCLFIKMFSVRSFVMCV